MVMAIQRVTLSAMLAAALFSGTALAAPKSQLVLAIGGEPEGGYDPLTGWGRYGHPLFQSTLLTRDAELGTRPDVAMEWSLSEDRLAWTIKLRPGTTFSDGSPLDAEDVAFTFNEAAKIGSAADLTALDTARAIDAQTVEIRLKKPWITFTENFYALGIVPSDSYGENYGRNPVGSGPYKLVSWTEGQQLIVEKNPNYYGDTGPFERITFLFTEEDTSLAAAQAKQVDMVSVPATAADATPEGFKQIVVKSVDNRGLVFPFVKDEGKTVGDGNKVGNTTTADPALRRAINLGIDRNQLVDVALLGHGSPASGPGDGLPWSNPEAAVAFDPDQAKKILDAAGWVPGDDGVRSKDADRAAFAINYPASDSTRRALAETVSAQLRALGIEATASGKSWDEIGRVMHSEPVLFGWGSHSPLEVYNLYQSSLAGIEFYNAGFYSNPVVDRHFVAAQNSANLEASFADWRRAEWDGTTGFGAKGDAAWAWLVNLDHVYYVNECLDIGPTQIEPHGHGWPITAMMQNWKWTCE